jgi:hypothetical protein
MVNDLTNSQCDRQNIPNNRYALEKVEEHLGLGGMTCNLPNSPVAIGEYLENLV